MSRGHEPIPVPVMRDGRRLDESCDLHSAHEGFRRDLERLPAAARRIEPSGSAARSPIGAGLDRQARSENRRNFRFEAKGPGDPADCQSKLDDGSLTSQASTARGGSAPSPPSSMTRQRPDVTSNPAVDGRGVAMAEAEQSAAHHITSRRFAGLPGSRRN